MLLNALLFWPMVFLGGYVLWGKSAVIFWIYTAVWLGILTLGRYFVCRRCKYYGTDCPTFGFSHIARIFRRDESKGFNGRACEIDALVQMLVMLLPILAWIFSAFDIVVSKYGTTDHIIMGVYVTLGLLMMAAHSANGCSKCDIVECRLSKAAKERKSKAQYSTVAILKSRLRAGQPPVIPQSWVI
jgi:hypothetical protein